MTGKSVKGVRLYMETSSVSILHRLKRLIHVPIELVDDTVRFVVREEEED